MAKIKEFIYFFNTLGAKLDLKETPLSVSIIKKTLPPHILECSLNFYMELVNTSTLEFKDLPESNDDTIFTNYHTFKKFYEALKTAASFRIDSDPLYKVLSLFFMSRKQKNIATILEDISDSFKK